jgi:hypothetical protein
MRRSHATISPTSAAVVAKKLERLKPLEAAGLCE